MDGSFSRVYCIPAESIRDSQRLRRRLGTYVHKLEKYKAEIISRIEIESGARVPHVGMHKSLDKFFLNSDLRDVLDAVTHVYDAILLKSRPIAGLYLPEQGVAAADALRWKEFAVRVFSEEHVSYSVDDKCQVRYRVDEVYSLSSAATLLGLGGERWSAVRAEFERAFSVMDAQPQDSNSAIRAIAAAVEACGKIVANGSPSRLGSPEIQRFIKPLCESAYRGDMVAINASSSMLRSLSAWVEAAQQYRHGQGEEGEVLAPVGLAVNFLTTGAGFIRWLVEMDQKVRRHADTEARTPTIPSESTE